MHTPTEAGGWEDHRGGGAGPAPRPHGHGETELFLRLESQKEPCSRCPWLSQLPDRSTKGALLSWEQRMTRLESDLTAGQDTVVRVGTPLRLWQLGTRYLFKAPSVMDKERGLQRDFDHWRAELLRNPCSTIHVVTLYLSLVVCL